MGGADGIQPGCRRLLACIKRNLHELGKGNHQCAALNVNNPPLPSLMTGSVNNVRRSPKKGDFRSWTLLENSANWKALLKSTKVPRSARARLTAVTCRLGSGSISVTQISTRRGRRRMSNRKCEACGGRGWLLSAVTKDALRSQIQRCDACELYENDQAAL